MNEIRNTANICENDIEIGIIEIKSEDEVEDDGNEIGNNKSEMICDDEIGDINTLNNVELTMRMKKDNINTINNDEMSYDVERYIEIILIILR